MAEKSLTSAHELVYAIAYPLVGISVIVNKTKSGLDFSMEESVVGRFWTLETLSTSSF